MLAVTPRSASHASFVPCGSTKYSATIDAFSTDDQFRRIPTSQVTHTQVDRKGAQEYFDSYG
ncbi:hypothetical protein, partial [Knoellia sp. Soil729]|uniref:hypothetical protein n=1 Tax=Knoellia sp. Soil729 TaxID=1736394 RepID=UPI001F2702C8